jgi:hypothetical protein
VLLFIQKRSEEQMGLPALSIMDMAGEETKEEAWL